MNVPCYDDNGIVINFYDIFNLPFTATAEDVRISFCALIKRYHTDVTGTNTELDRKKINLIINGYKTLVDDALRAEYDAILRHNTPRTARGHLFIPRKRVRYTFSLRDLLQKRLLNPRMKRRDFIHNLGQDVEILITPQEAARGAVAFVELPSRSQCPLCFGRDPECHVCEGIGRIATTTNLQVTIAPGAIDNTFMDFDLMKITPDRLTSFTMRALRVKISIVPS